MKREKMSVKGIFPTNSMIILMGEYVIIDSNNNVSYPNNPRKMFVLCFSCSLKQDLFNRFKSNCAVEIYDVQKFICRIENKLEEVINDKQFIGYDRVRYHDNPKDYGFINGSVPINKNKFYEMEDEYRIFFNISSDFIENHKMKSNPDFLIDFLIYRFKFNIGSINDIAKLIKISEGY